MSFKKKKSGDDGAAGLAQQRDQAIGDLSNYGNQGINTLESSKLWYNPPESQKLYNTALDKYNNFDVNANRASDEAYNANYKPILNEVTANLGNSFSGMGAAGRNNSRGQFAQAVLSQNLADNAGKQLLGVRNDARNQYLNEAQNLFNSSFGVMQQLQGIDTNKANAQTQLGQSLANTRMGAAGNIAQIQQQNAQLAAQQKAQSKNGIGSAIGGAVSLASAFSDERLKENIKSIGKLPNGVPLYSYNIKGTDLPQIGVLAQEAQLYKPNAVHLDSSGYLKVNYQEVAV